MIYRTYNEALDERTACSWKQKVIVTVKLKSGITFFRTYVWDTMQGLGCRACRNSSKKAGRNGSDFRRLPSTGHHCECCGNPYAGFVRQHRTKRTGVWETMKQSWSGGGRLW